MKQIDNILSAVSNNRKSHFWIFFAVLLMLSFVMIYFYQPLCPGQDFFFHYRRFQALMDGMQNSSFLIYIDSTAIDGYGYFTKAFYSDFILIPFALIGNLTSIEFAYQFMIFTMTVLCGVFTYLFVNRVYKNPLAAAISALLFTFCVYRLLDIYHRAALGESLSFTFIPLVFWGLYEIIKGDYRKWYILTIGYSLMIFTHVISSVLMFMTMLIFLIIYSKSLFSDRKRVYSLIIAGIVTLVIVAYYLYPMIEQMMSNTFYYQSREIMSKAADSGLQIHWLIWGLFSGIVAPAQAFIPGIGVLLTCIVFLRLFINLKSAQLKSLDIGIIIGIVYIFAASSFFPWKIFPFSLLNFIQMGWRLFEFTSFFFAIAGGYYLALLLKTNKRRLFGGTVICIAILFVFINDSKMYEIYRCGRPVTQEAAFSNDYHLGGLEYIPEKVPSIEYIHQRGNKVDYARIEKTADISNMKKNKGITSFDLKTDTKDILELPLIYYKGYTAKLNDEKIPVTESDNGLIEISVDAPGKVTVYYGGTSIQKISFFLTLAGIVGLCVYIFMSSRRKQHEKNV